MLRNEPRLTKTATEVNNEPNLHISNLIININTIYISSYNKKTIKNKLLTCKLRPIDIYFWVCYKLNMQVQKKSVTFSNAQKMFIYANGHDRMADRTIFNSKNKNYRRILDLLEIRSWETNGDTKFNDSEIAKELGISIRCVQLGMSFLERHGFIMRLYKKFTVPGVGLIRTDRFIRVFTVFYQKGCKPKFNLWKLDWRPKSNLDKLKQRARNMGVQVDPQPKKTHEPKIKNDPNFVPVDPLMDKLAAQNPDVKAESSITWAQFEKFIKQDLNGHLVSDDCLDFYEQYMIFRKYHEIGVESKSLKILGYPTEYLLWKNRRH